MPIVGDLAYAVTGAAECEPALGPEKAPEHRVSLESNEKNFLSLKEVDQ